MKKMYYIFFLLTAVSTYAQVNLVVATEKNTRDYREDDEVVVNILLEVAGKDMVQQTPLRMFDTSKFEIVASGSEQNTFIDSKTGFRVNRTLYQYVLKPKKAGKIKIGSASVIVNEKLHYTEPFDIFVVESDKKLIADKSFNDVFLNVEVEDGEVFKNQPTVAVLKAYSRNLNSFRKVRNIKYPDQENINIRQVSSKNSEIEPAGNMSSQVLAVFLIYPTESGRVELSPVSADLSSDKRKILSNKIRLKVKDLPAEAPAGYKDAVGNFEVSVSHNGEKAEVEKPLQISLKISGQGNFVNMTLPKISESPEYRFFPPKIIRNTVSSRSGVEGEVTANYVVIPKIAGPITVRTDSFSYFNPETMEYVKVGRKEVLLEALTHSEILAARTPLEKVNDYTNTVLETVDNPVIKTTALRVQEKKTLNWNTLWINFGLLLAAFVGFLLVRKSRRSSTDKGTPNTSLGSVAETEQALRAQHKTDVNDYEPFLTQLKESREYERFFDALTELDGEIRKDHNVASVADFKVFLEKNRGQQLAEEYRSLQHKIQMEKYAPVHTPEYIGELLRSVVNLYGQIAK